MSAPEFLDTNVLVYAYDHTVPSKQQTARHLLLRALTSDLVASTQVLSEFASTMLHKPKLRTRPENVLAALAAFSSIRVVTSDASLVRRAIEAHSKYGIHFYDGMIVAAAQRAGCSRIWSEDLNAGQKYFGVVVENPFN